VRAAASRDDRQAGKAARAALANQTRPLRQEITRLDERLGKLGAEKAEVEAALAAPGQPADTYADLGRRLAHVGAEIAMLEERWLEVSTELESLKAE
jgi:ATP-binding cassette, subfamily F, member 3